MIFNAHYERAVVTKPWGFACYEKNSADDEILTHRVVGITREADTAAAWLESGNDEALRPAPDWLLV